MDSMKQCLIDASAEVVGASLAAISVLTKRVHQPWGERFDSFFGVQIPVSFAVGAGRLGPKAAC